MCHPFSRPALERLFYGIQFGMDDGSASCPNSQRMAGGLTWRIARRLVCADALRLGTSRAPAKTPARPVKYGGNNGKP
jgi:hypothetical protein